MKIESRVVFFILFSALSACSYYKYAIYADPLDKKKVTKKIIDQNQLVSDSFHTVLRSANNRKKKPCFLLIDTFAVIKPFINVEYTEQETWQNNPALLDTNDVRLFKRHQDIEIALWHEWNLYANTFFTKKNYHIVEINQVEYKAIQEEVSEIERILDHEKKQEYLMSNTFYSILSKVTGEYCVMLSIKFRHSEGGGINPVVGYMRGRIFIFNLKSRKILYYNRTFRGFAHNEELRFFDDILRELRRKFKLAF